MKYPNSSHENFQNAFISSGDSVSPYFSTVNLIEAAVIYEYLSETPMQQVQRVSCRELHFIKNNSFQLDKKALKVTTLHSLQ